MNILCLRHRSDLPESNRSSEGIYADSEGTLKHLGSDGNVTDLGGAGGGAQPLETVVDEVLFSDVVAGEGEFPSWPGVAPFRTIPAGAVVFACWIIVTEVFNYSGFGSEIQVTNDPEGDGTQLSNAANPAALGTSDGAVWRYSGGTIGGSFSVAGCIAPYQPKAGPVTPIVGFSSGFNDDGTTGRALIFTTIYIPA